MPQGITPNKKIRLKKSQLRTEYLNNISQFQNYAPQIDSLFFKLYGKNFPYHLEKSLHSMGDDSRAICVWYQDKLIGFAGFIHENLHNRIEYGRMIKHPEYQYDITIMAPNLNRAKVEIEQNPDRIFYGTTRLCFSA